MRQANYYFGGIEHPYGFQDERMKLLQGLVPGCDKVTGKALMLDEIINYVQSLQNQVEFLFMKLAFVNLVFYDFSVDLDDHMSKSETTYENFRYQYDQRANPYNQRVVKNFKEVFFTSIPPSKDKFRARVPQDLGMQQRSVVGGFMSPNMGKAVGDLEVGRKATWGEAREGTTDLEAGFSHDGLENKDGGFIGEASLDLSQALPTEGMEGRAAVHHPRHSSWGRRSGSWEISPDVLAMAAEAGESDRIGGGSSTDGNH